MHLLEVSLLVSAFEIASLGGLLPRVCGPHAHPGQSCLRSRSPLLEAFLLGLRSACSPWAVEGEIRLLEASSSYLRASSPLLEAPLLGSAVLGFFVELASVREGTFRTGRALRRDRFSWRPPSSCLWSWTSSAEPRRRLVLSFCFARTLGGAVAAIASPGGRRGQPMPLELHGVLAPTVCWKLLVPSSGGLPSQDHCFG